MKAHIGVDAETGLVHGVRATPANTHDLREAGGLNYPELVRLAQVAPLSMTEQAFLSRCTTSRCVLDEKGLETEAAAARRALLHGGEEEVWADAGYRGIEKWVDTGGRPVQWHVAMRPGRRRLLEQGGARWLRERDKASVRAKVEHPFLYVKRRFGYRKVRYRGLAKNMERIALLLGFANLLVAGRYSTA